MVHLSAICLDFHALKSNYFFKAENLQTLEKILNCASDIIEISSKYVVHKSSFRTNFRLHFEVSAVS